MYSFKDRYGICKAFFFLFTVLLFLSIVFLPFLLFQEWKAAKWLNLSLQISWCFLGVYCH